MHLIEWLAHCVGPELLNSFGRDFWPRQSHGTFGWALALHEFKEEEEEEEEVGNSKGVGKQRWEARGPVRSEWQTSQRNRHSASSDSMSSGQHSTHQLIYLGKKCMTFNRPSRKWKWSHLRWTPTLPLAPKPQPPLATCEWGLQTSNNKISLWLRTPCRGGVYKHLLRSLTWKNALTILRRMQSKRWEPRHEASAKQEDEWVLIS